MKTLAQSVIDILDVKARKGCKRNDTSNRKNGNSDGDHAGNLIYSIRSLTEVSPPIILEPLSKKWPPILDI